MEPNRGRTTIADVAARAGVSEATVSRALNDRYGVATRTVERVRAVARELGYESSLGARSLRTARTFVIGALVPDIGPFSAEIMKGIFDGVRGTGYELLVYTGDSTSSERVDRLGWERRFLSRIAGTLTDGTIVVTPTVSDMPNHLPLIAIDPNVDMRRIPSVASDNTRGAVLAVEHLISLGHRRIGFLAGRPDLRSARQREAGYRKALRAHGIPVEASLIEEGAFTFESATGPARRLLDRPDRPTAVFAANDQSAAAVLEIAARRRIAVPQDLSVIGFDNTPESALMSPPLTTVDQRLSELGRQAVRLLLERLADPQAGSQQPRVRSVTVRTGLVARSTCGPPQA